MTDNYTIVEEIGKGSYGAVFKVQRKDEKDASGKEKYYCWKEINYGHL